MSDGISSSVIRSIPFCSIHCHISLDRRVQDVHWHPAMFEDFQSILKAMFSPNIRMINLDLPVILISDPFDSKSSTVSTTGDDRIHEMNQHVGSFAVVHLDPRDDERRPNVRSDLLFLGLSNRQDPIAIEHCHTKESKQCIR